ncbi:hypothetical protein [Nocardia brasiliensis]|uniref:hypothetical protein n=2 Tax=Nocardia brasiliensis TaxID=37326 RepID=UPI0018937281|nr:hypothetical protein [Nocardia brasiliensis]MBF6547361.1 hypothetical protein [Nocardia brasiliensis]
MTMPIISQRDWRFCDKCFSLWFNGRPTNGACAAGGSHSSAQSGDYALIGDSDGSLPPAVLAQRDWRFCDKCFSLWFNGRPTNGACAAGGSHSSAQSGDYALITSPNGNF